MELKIHCSNCGQALRVPADAAGKRARCPYCRVKFQIPPSKDILDEMVATWFKEGVGQLVEEKKQQIDQLNELQREIRQSISDVADSEDDEPQTSPDSGTGREVADTPGVTEAAGGSEVSGVSGVPGVNHGAARASITPATHARHRNRLASDSSSQDATVSDRVGASGYPDELFPTQPRPYLVVDHCDQHGVTLAFDARFMEDERFTTSLPMQCAFTGEHDVTQLLARPLAFCDQSKGEAMSPHEIEAGHEWRLTTRRTPQEVVKQLGVLEMLPGPFKYPMPYYISATQTTLSLACWTHKRADEGQTAFVQFPDGFYALKWLARVNGVCGAEYVKLKHDVELLFGGQWRLLSEDCRRRLAVWCPFEAGEQFRHFVSDAEFNHRDAGLGGLVLTDRRLVYQKYHKHGQAMYGEGTRLVIEHGTAGLAEVTIHSPQGKAKGLCLHLTEIPKLMAVAAEVNLPAEVELEEEYLKEPDEDGRSIPTAVASPAPGTHTP